MLRLSPAQEEQLLQLRKKHLRNLRNLYEDRQRLNLGVSQLSTHSGNAKQATPDFAVYLPNGAGLSYLLSKAGIDASCDSKMSESAGSSMSHTKLVDHGEITANWIMKAKEEQQCRCSSWPSSHSAWLQSVRGTLACQWTALV